MYHMIRSLVNRPHDSYWFYIPLSGFETNLQIIKLFIKPSYKHLMIKYKKEKYIVF